MTIKGHSITQIILMVLHAINLFSGLVPPKYQPIVLFIIATLQGVVGVLNHYYTPQGTKIVALLLLALFLGDSARAQTPPPADVPITHVSISASFNGYDSNGHYIPSNVDTFGVAVYRNKAATQGFNVSYEHIAIPELGQRWEMGLGSYWLTLPKVKNLLFDTSNFVVTVSAGAGKLLSVQDGNRFAWTVAPSVTYPIAGHMAWTVSYQYLRATGGISGTLNKSYSVTGTGPVIYF